jgi:hypothetical protein
MRGLREWVGLVVLVWVVLPAAGRAAPRTDPDWPCQQIKVAELSLPAVWSGPEVDPLGGEWKNDPAVVDLVQRLTPRREPIEQAEALIRTFAKGEDGKGKLLQVLVGVFSTLCEERASVMAGLDRFGRRQKELAAQVRADNEKLRALQGDPAADAGAVNQAVQLVTWEADVFQDRRQAISYACAVPGKIEQRLFALAHAIQDAVQ